MDLQVVAQKILKALEILDAKSTLIVLGLAELFMIFLLSACIISLVAAWIKFFWIALIFA